MGGGDSLGSEAVVEAMLDAVIAVGLDGKIRRMNPATTALLGYEHRELIGKPISTIFADDESALRTTRLERPTAGQPVRKEDVEIRAKSGELIPASVIGAPVFENQKLEGLVLVARDLRETKRLVSEVRAAKGEVETRLAAAKESLLRAERLATLGTLAAGVGHELGNIASVLSMTLEVIKSGEPLDDELLGALDHVDLHVREHAARLLRLATPGPTAVEYFELGELVRETVAMCQRSGRCRHLEIRQTGEVKVWARRVRIEQVLVNLIFNAADAIGDRSGELDGTIEISIEERHGRGFCSVSDNGCGIESDRLGSVFEAFHTTKAPDKGTGLGLAVAQQIVSEHRGRMTVESVVGQGTTFVFDLPTST